ncbi:SAM-dependent methyltransferase [Bacillus paranthracis]
MGESFEGILFSNELFDAFPVEVIEKRNGILYEVRCYVHRGRKLAAYVGHYIKQFVVTLLKYNIHLAEGQRFEVPIAMEEYIKEIAKWFQRRCMYYS